MRQNHPFQIKLRFFFYSLLQFEPVDRNDTYINHILQYILTTYI